MNLNSTTAQSSTRTLLSNATACQVLANIIAMQFYYPATGYAYQVYQSYIWQPSQIWTASSPRLIKQNKYLILINNSFICIEHQYHFLLIHRHIIVK
jgi:hypothetical protein